MGRERAPQTIVLAASCLILLALPFVTSYNDLLTAAGMRLGVAGPLQSVSPLEARMVVALLGLVGVHAAAATGVATVSLRKGSSATSTTLPPSGLGGWPPITGPSSSMMTAECGGDSAKFHSWSNSLRPAVTLA